MEGFYQPLGISGGVILEVRKYTVAFFHGSACTDIVLGWS